MPESAPAPALPPVPWWERLAAGVLVAGLVTWLASRDLLPAVWWYEVAYAFERVHANTSAIIHTLVGNGSVFSNRLLLITALADGLDLIARVAFPILIAGGLAILLGFRQRRWRNGLWYLSLGHGVVGFLMALAGFWYHKLMESIVGSISVAGRDPSTIRYWLFAREMVPYYAETLLAALVLTLGWWRRRREGEAQAEPK